MSKDWEYASLGSSERLDLIRKGNEDVYASEKNRNSALKELKMSLGMSTNDIDSWDAMVDDARNKYISGKLITDRDISALSGSSAKSATHLLNNQLDAIDAELSVKKSKAFKSAKDELEGVAEWLASNGYSVKSNTAKKAKKEIEDELATELSLLETEYRQKSLQAIASAISRLR